MEQTIKNDVSDFDESDLIESSGFKGEYWDVEEWYPLIENLTFRTQFISLSMRDVDFIMKEHETRAKYAKEGESIFKEEDISNRLKTIEEMIDKILSQFPSHAAFIRLSTLSPKDATKTDPTKIVTTLKSELQKLGLSTRPVVITETDIVDSTKPGDRDVVYSESSTIPEEIIALNRCVYQLCKVKSGKEAVDLIVASDRVYRHLSHRRVEEKQFRMSIVVREWVDFKPELEFRSFIHKGELTAITHYYEFLYVKEIAENKKKILQSIKEFFEKEVKNVLNKTHESYVCDFAIIDDRVVVIELNPFEKNTSSALFDWDEPSDYDILTGKKPLEFRIKEKPDFEAKKSLGSWGLYLEILRPSRDETVTKKKEKSKNCIIS